MKNENLLTEAITMIEGGDYDAAKERITTFLLTQKVITSDVKFKLHDVCSTDTYRENMAGVYHDPDGWRVATDAHLLCAVKDDAIPAELSGKIISAKSGEIEGNFPNWRSVMPRDAEGALSTGFKTITFDLDTAIKVCKEAITYEKKLRELTTVILRAGETTLICLRPDLFLKQLSFMRAYDVTCAYWRDKSYPLYCDNGAARGILMPCNGVRDENEATHFHIDCDFI